ncbi:hypothetical protein ACLOJK_022748 [Asimina triloba]
MSDGAPSWSTYGAPPSSFGGGCHGGRRSSIPSPVKPLHRRPKLSSTARARHRRHHVEHGAPPPSTATNDAHEDAVAGRPRPTTAGPSLPRSKPFIMTATTSTFQIHRGRKPTLITVVTRGESSSPVINKFNSISLQSSKNGSKARQHRSFSSKAHPAVDFCCCPLPATTTAPPAVDRPSPPPCCRCSPAAAADAPTLACRPPVSIAGCPLCRPSAIAQPPLPMTRPPASARAD